ncbi:small G protein signaling modulator 1-like isoform X1 [Camellia sinensis]|uniref:small G protein signaling modulator 1-like isoform X1 n=2 Tax=Camellia sinensis TaxID=4442 RepID=UPI001036BC98|nr:small G protein signaling modulator 1-like isoform X1 [Camellia sinensis]XP_028126785.1 small G protein signaling modulator 1-like isoform X1 [Camellia sinensis]
MSFDEDNKQWICGKAGTVSLHRVSCIVRDIGEPCLHQSPIKVVIAISKMLKPDKWQATFDSDGKVFGFQKALKSIILGGVDPSIRPEVWEFLLGCYTLSSTAEHRRQLRTARRERYGDLINQCQMMHSSIGTGSLAYAVGSKVMDMRTMSKDGGRSEPQVKSRHASDNAKRLENYCDWDNNCTDTPYACEGESSSDSADLASVRGSTDSAAYDSSCFIPTSGPYNCHSPKLGSEAHGSQYVTESYFDFPPLPVTDLFEKNGKDGKGREFHDNRLSTRRKLQFEDDHMHSFQINNNVDLIMESNGSSYNDVSRPINCEIEMVHSDAHDPASSWSSNLEHKTEIINELRISDVPDTPSINATTSQGGPVSEDRVSEWLWTLHRIVVDVVRTDSHLEFYEDSKNLARMSDILAVYAWVDPATGYCQGMSDLLSPFVVLFEDNADAFWCFEMLLRRMRESFQMEGPTGVMKQLQALWRILEITDKEMFAHLSHIGAESLHFAFRMLLVLFRRELTFNEALCMWEMMWAADFDESVSCNLEENCLEPLVIEIPRESGAEMGEESVENVKGNIKGVLQSNHGNGDPSIADSSGIKSASTHSFCGLTRNFWSKNDRLHMCTVVSSRRNGDDELPVFCVAAILFTNRQKIIRETNSIDDLIKIFNDRMLKIRVKRCVNTAIKLRKKYFYKLIKSRSPASQHND